MLQRAASNAYSWWWASHIRTKQSKWLEQSLQDMEDKVQGMLKLIEEDGDSFAKRAEMYYKRRPELISSVEEAYKVFRALADRYDLLSKDLQNANQKIATVFPDQVPYEMEDDDESPTPKVPKNIQIPGGNVPKVPKAPIKDLKSLITTASKKFQSKKSSNKSSQIKNKVVEKSGLSKDQALEEIDSLQKNILALQTVKEFVKSSYESGLEKYWGIENQIMEMQQKVCGLQDEFAVDRVIEDDEARTLMAEAALKSCQEVLAQLQEKQERSTHEMRAEYKRIESARLRLNSFKHEYLKNQIDDEEKTSDKEGGDDARNDRVVELVKETKELELQKPKGNLLLSPTSPLTVTQLAEKIDELVTKVISLETAVSSQTVLITTLRTDADDLHEQIRKLEDEKETLIGDTHNLSLRVKEMEDKLNKIQELNKNVESQNNSLQSNFVEARSSLDHLSEKLSSVKPDEEVEETQSVSKPDEEVEETQSVSHSTLDEIKNPSQDEVEQVKEVEVDVQSTEASVPKKEAEKTEKKTVTFIETKPNEEASVADSITGEVEGGEKEKEDELNWQQMLLSGMEDREKILLKEYTTILRNYKEVKKKLSDMEKNERDSQFDITLQIRELKKAILKRDEEIQSLRQKLGNEGDLGRNEKPEEVEIQDFKQNEVSDTPKSNKEDDVIKFVYVNRGPPVSVMEEKLRLDIDAILNENLDFWLRFSTSFHQIQKFKTQVQDLQDEISKLKEKKAQEGSATTQVKSEVRPIYKHLREIQTELTVWLEQSSNLKDELKRRLASLCSIQEEITKALKEGVEEDEIRFSSHQAAKFQGEILNMKQENNKVREELQAGLDHVSLLQLEIEKTLRKLNDEFGISSDQPQGSANRSRIPLHSFIFGTKVKKQKNSIFSCMHPNRRYGVLRGSGHAHVSVSSNQQH